MAGPVALVLMVLHFVRVFCFAAEVTPLPDAAEKKDWPRVESFLNDKSDTNTTQADGMTALTGRCIMTGRKQCRIFSPPVPK